MATQAQLIAQIQADIADLRQTLRDHVRNDSESQAIMNSSLIEVSRGIEQIQITAMVREKTRKEEMEERERRARVENEKRGRVIAVIAAASPIAMGIVTIAINLHH